MEGRFECVTPLFMLDECVGNNVSVLHLCLCWTSVEGCYEFVIPFFMLDRCRGHCE